MSVTLYRHPNYLGEFTNVSAGYYAGSTLRGFHEGGTYERGVSLCGNVGSIRVRGDTILGVYPQDPPGGGKVIIGPSDIPDTASLNMHHGIWAVQVFPAKRAGPETQARAVMYGPGMHRDLGPGEWPAEVLGAAGNPSAVTLARGTVAIFTSGGYETASAGPVMLDDAAALGLEPPLSVRVIAVEIEGEGGRVLATAALLPPSVAVAVPAWAPAPTRAPPLPGRCRGAALCFIILAAGVGLIYLAMRFGP
jgi:hypothetical protein